MNKIIFENKLASMNKTKKEIAEEMGMNPSRLSDMLSGRLKGWKYRRRISKYLGISEDILFHDDGNQDSCQI